MTAQVLDRTLTAFRIGDPDGAFPIFSAIGAQFAPGRWHTTDAPMIYASEHYSTAMLEVLVRTSGRLPPNQHFIEITVDASVSYEMFSTGHHPGWDAAEPVVARAYGRAWRTEARSAILIVPSVVARMEQNVLINPAHSDVRNIRAGLHRPVWWDARLFG